MKISAWNLNNWQPQINTPTISLWKVCCKWARKKWKSCCTMKNGFTAFSSASTPSSANRSRGRRRGSSGTGTVSPCSSTNCGGRFPPNKRSCKAESRKQWCVFCTVDCRVEALCRCWTPSATCSCCWRTGWWCPLSSSRSSSALLPPSRSWWRFPISFCIGTLFGTLISSKTQYNSNKLLKESNYNKMKRIKNFEFLAKD